MAADAFAIVMIVSLSVGLPLAAVFGALAMRRQHAGWLVACCAALIVGSVPLLMGGFGVVGIAGAVVILGAARAMPGRDKVLPYARLLATLALGIVVALQLRGKARGNAPSMVDWILVVLAVAMFIVAWAPARGAHRATAA